MDSQQLTCSKYSVRIDWRFSKSNSIVVLSELGSMSVTQIVNELKRIHDQAYQLGVQEAKEMTRGKYLHVFGTNAYNNRK